MLSNTGIHGSIYHVLSKCGSPFTVFYVTTIMLPTPNSSPHSQAEAGAIYRHIEDLV